MLWTYVVEAGRRQVHLVRLGTRSLSFFCCCFCFVAVRPDQASLWLLDKAEGKFAVGHLLLLPYLNEA